MKLWIEIDGSLLNEVEYFDLSLECLKKVLYYWNPNRIFYNHIPNNKNNLINKINYVHEWIFPHHFYSSLVNINYKTLLLFGRENVQRMLILWSNDGKDGYLVNLRQNYEKYFNEAEIKDIIE